MGVTIKDIAAEANVSMATVSLVLNNKPGIKQETTDKVLEIAKKLNYKSSQTKLLSSAERKTIRFLQIVKHGHTINRDHDIFITDYINGIHDEATEFGFNLEISTYKISEMMGIPEISELLNEASIHGAIILGTELSAEDIIALGTTSTPVVFMDTFYSYLNYNFVDMDNIDSVYNIVSTLYNHGHREIGIINTTVDVNNFHRRELGFKQALHQLGLKLNNNHIYTVDSTHDGAYKDMHKILKTPHKLPTALFATNDITAYGCIKAMEEEGISIPDDISIIGFDDLPMSSVMKPALTTMQVSKNQIGKISTCLLRQIINSDGHNPATKILISGNLISRDSVKNL